MFKINWYLSHSLQRLSNNISGKIPTYLFHALKNESTYTLYRKPPLNIASFSYVHTSKYLNTTSGSTVTSKYGLTEDEKEVYKRSLSNLCGQMMRASQDSLASKKSEATSVSSNMDKYGLSHAEKEVYKRSLGDLCTQMKRASRASSRASRGSLSRNNSTESEPCRRSKVRERE